MKTIIEKLRDVVEEAERLDNDEHCSGVTIVPIHFLREVVDETWRLERALDAHCRANLGLATTRELIEELAARARTDGWMDPDYRTIGDIATYRRDYGLEP